MGNTCKPMAVSFQCMTKFTTNKKKKRKKQIFLAGIASEEVLPPPCSPVKSSPVAWEF